MIENKNQDKRLSTSAVQRAFTLSSRAQLAVLPDGTRPEPLGSGVVRSILGEGGVAIVYDVWNEQLGVSRAVKVLKPSHSPEALNRFHTEMKIMAQLRHPNIVEIHAVGKWNHLPYIEMEKIDGLALDRIVRRRGALPLEACTAIGIMIARSLAYTHNSTFIVGEKKYKGILHRDLKPANVMMACDGLVKLTDFGIARPAEISLHTMEGYLVGSLQYLAPEQLDGDSYDARADLFSFGCVLYELVTGFRAFAETNVSRLVPQRTKNAYKSLSEYKIKIPAKLRKLIIGCMELDPEKRPSSAEDVLASLERIHHKLTSLSPAETARLFMDGDEEKRIVHFRRRVWPNVARIGGVAVGTIALGLGIFHGSAILKSGNTTVVSAVEQPDEGKTNTPVSAEKEKPAPSSAGSTIEHASIPQLAAKTPAGAGPEVHKADGTKPERESVGKPSSVTRREKPVVIPAERRVVSEQRIEQSLLDRLAQKHGISDPISIMGRELSAGNYDQALEVYDELSPARAQEAQALIFKLRALEGVRRSSEIGSFLRVNNVEDSEFYMAKARHLIRNGMYEQALSALKRVEALPASFADKDALLKNVVYFRAECRSGMFSAEKTESAKEAALQSWYDVKYAYRNNQNHRFFREANENIRSIWSSQVN